MLHWCSAINITFPALLNIRCPKSSFLYIKIVQVSKRLLTKPIILTGSTVGEIAQVYVIATMVPQPEHAWLLGMAKRTGYQVRAHLVTFEALIGSGNRSVCPTTSRAEGGRKGGDEKLWYCGTPNKILTNWLLIMLLEYCQEPTM